MSPEAAIHVHEEESVTPSGLIRIGLIVAITFPAMAAMGEGEFRAFTLALGGVGLAAVAACLINILWQRRYGFAVFYATGPFEPGKVFQGYIETGVRERPTARIRLRVYGTFHRSRPTFVRDRVDPSLFQTTAAGTLRIPIFMEVPDNVWISRAGEIYLRAQTASWPIGWGATFRIHRRG